MRTLALFCLAALAGCGGVSVGPGSRSVGGACQTDANCDHRCVINGHFPNGLCTLTCGSTADCPVGSACVDDSGGICEILCSAVSSCAQFGSLYQCMPRDSLPNGQVSVCRVP